MKHETKKEILDLIGKDNREIKKIERARARRDARFFDDWFDKYTKTGKDFWLGDDDKKSRRDDWL
jgi:hypothetical protein